MSLEIHEEARKRFNQVGLQLLGRLSASIPKPERRAGIDPDFVVAAELNESNIVSFGDSVLHDPRSGEEIARHFYEGNGRVGLEADHHRTFVELVQNLSRTPPLRSSVSVSLLRETVFNWFKACRSKRTRDGLCEYLSHELSSRIAVHRVWVPVHLLHMARPLQVGHVSIQNISREIFEGWATQFRSGGGAVLSASESEAVESGIANDRKRVQGYAACVLEVNAEPGRAFERAMEETNVALGALRMFSPAALSYGPSCYCVPLGRQTLASREAIVLLGENVATWLKHSDDRGAVTWSLSASELDQMERGLLPFMNGLIRADSPSPFQTRVLDAMLLYSQATLTRDPAGKLVYMLPALESVFIRKSQEPIQENLSVRMALCIGESLKERKQIVRTVKKVYELRSGFLHGGRRPEDTRALSQFMSCGWRAIMTVVESHEAYKSAEDFLDDLDERKLSGSLPRPPPGWQAPGPS